MAQSHIFSGTAITAIGLGRGWLETPWPGTGRQQYRKQYPPQAQRAAAMGIPPRRHPLAAAAAALAAETGRGKRPTQNSPGGWAAAPSRPFSSSPQWQRSGCHFETSGAVPLRPGPQGQSTDGPRMEDMLSLGHTLSMKSPAFHSLGTPRSSGAEGPHPPHIQVQPPMLPRGPPSAPCLNPPQIRPPLGTTPVPRGRLDWDNYQARSLCTNPLQMPTPSRPPTTQPAGPPLTGPQDPTGPPTPGGHFPGLWAQKGCGKTSTHQHISLARPPGAAICRLSHHFHFPPPLKQPPSSLALEATQPKLHTPSYSQMPPSLAQTGFRNWETDTQQNSLGSLRPGPLPQHDQWSLSPAP